MKISNNIPAQSPKQSTNFKGKVINFKPQNTGEASVKSTVDPSYYQALSGIKMPLSANFQDTDGNIVEIETYDAEEYLTDKNGKIDPNLVKKFKSLYIETEQKLKTKKQQEITYYENLLSKHPDIIELETPVDTLNQAIMDQLSTNELDEDVEFNFCKGVLSGISGEIKEELAKETLEVTRTQLEEIPAKTYDRTVRLFQLSKTDDRYDFSSLDEKNRLISIIDEMSYQYGENYDIDDLYDEIIESAANDDGTLDYTLIDTAVSMIYNIGGGYSPKYVIDLMKTYIAKDPANKEQIIETMQRLNNSDFIMDENEHDFEDLMDLCFDKDNHFNSERSNTLFRLTASSKDWISGQLKRDFADLKNSCNVFNGSVNVCKNIILDYYKKAVDEDGNFTPDKLPSPESYFEAKTEKLCVL